MTGQKMCVLLLERLRRRTTPQLIVFYLSLLFFLWYFSIFPSPRLFLVSTHGSGRGRSRKRISVAARQKAGVSPAPAASLSRALKELHARVSPITWKTDASSARAPRQFSLRCSCLVFIVRYHHIHQAPTHFRVIMATSRPMSV